MREPGAPRQFKSLGLTAPRATFRQGRAGSGTTYVGLVALADSVSACGRLSCGGASAAAVDGEGGTALHACCIDLNLSTERAEAGLDCNPPAVVALLLARGCPVQSASNDGMTALDHCESHKGRHAAAEACAAVLEQWATSAVLESTRL